MQKKTEEQKKEREEAIEQATQEATRVPLNVLRDCISALELASKVARHGNKNSISDAGVAALMARAAAEGAYYNVIINLPGISEAGFVKDARDEAGKLRAQAADLEGKIKSEVEKQLQASSGS
jgi:glutamate formiminotransferase/formiminotetrahydrofolate cyclodeaminase